MITIDNMHQGYIFRMWSVVLLVVQCYSVTGSADVHFFCLLYFIYLLEGVLCCCSCPLCALRGGGGLGGGGGG